MTPRLQMTGVVKRFGAVLALDGVDLIVGAGEVHALLGENGAGKSTLMKVLSGAHAPDEGSLCLDGEPYRPRGPLDARDRGIAMIYQELNLAPDLTVADNVLLGREVHRLGVVARRRSRQRVRDALAFLDHDDIAPETRVCDLGPGPRQLVEIARALVGDAKVIVMDEPTSSLSRPDAEKLEEVIARLRDRGVSIVYISHYLEEVYRVASRYTVLRDGQTVGSGPVEGTTTEELIELMVGRSLDEVFPRVPHSPSRPILSLARLAGAALPTEASLTLRRGEIFGVVGLVGAGRTELLRAVFGLDPVRSGSVTVGAVTDRGASPRRRLDQGVGLLSESRKEEGLAVGRSIAENVTLSRMAPLSFLGWVDMMKRRRKTDVLVERLSIRCRDAEQSVGELSGGNQQKVAIARLLHHDVDVLLLDEPTRGIDVGSKVEVYRLIGELAARGKAILFVSSYIPELLGTCDRIAVMHRGRLGASRPAGEWDEASLLDEASRGAAA